MSVVAGVALIASLCLTGSVLEAAFVAPPALASVCGPGPGACVPDLFPAETGTLLATLSGPWTNSGSTMSGAYTEAVYANPANTFCSGCLDFALQVTNNAGSTDSIGRVTVSSFAGALADIGYSPVGSAYPGGLFVDGTAAPQLVDRVLPGDSIGFTFNAPVALPIAPGQTSTVLEVQTNATHFGVGNANINDGGVTTVVGFAPVVDNDLSIGSAPNITTTATGLSGAAVSYSVPTASDEGGETPTVGCNPASGSTFPVGTTTVTCTATDGDDTNSPVTTTFTVTVNRASRAQASVSPYRFLTNGEKVWVSGRRFPPGDAVTVVECNPLVSTQGLAACDQSHPRMVMVTKYGHVPGRSYLVADGTIGTGAGAGPCDHADPCLMVVYDTANPAINAAAPIYFAVGS